MSEEILAKEIKDVYESHYDKECIINIEKSSIPKGYKFSIGSEVNYFYTDRVKGLEIGKKFLEKYLENAKK